MYSKSFMGFKLTHLVLQVYYLHTGDLNDKDSSRFAHQVNTYTLDKDCQEFDIYDFMKFEEAEMTNGPIYYNGSLFSLKEVSYDPRP